jgi:hypothetical protein
MLDWRQGEGYSNDSIKKPFHATIDYHLDLEEEGLK